MKNKEDYIEAGMNNIESSACWRLFKTGCCRVRGRLAENPSTPKDLVRKLARDPDSDVRAAIARNSSVDLELIEMLCDDEDVNVRLSLAYEASLPTHILDKLMLDSNPYVVASAEKTLEIIYMEDELTANRFKPEGGNQAKLGELFYAAGILDRDTIVVCLQLSINQNKHLGHVFIQELSISRQLIIKALRLQSRIRKGQISLVQAVYSLKHESSRFNVPRYNTA